MEAKRFNFTFTFAATVVSLLLIIINGAWLAVNGEPIVISSFQTNSVEEVTGSDVFWGRIVFGFSRAAETAALAIWVVLVVIMFYSAFEIYRHPRSHKQYGLLIAAASILALPFGGGFYLGTVLGFLAGVAGVEWPKPFRETFFGYLASVARLSPRFFSAIAESSNLLNRGAMSVALIGFLAGLGSGLYTYNANLIGQGEMAHQILLEGGIMWHQNVFMASVSSIMITLVKWLILSACVFWIGAKLTGLQSEYSIVAQTVAFCYVPVALEAFMPILFANEPALSFTWPVGLYTVSRLWFLCALTLAVNRLFDVPLRKSLGIALLGGLIYWIVLHTMIIPALNVPGVQIMPSLPESSPAILFTGGLIAIFSILFGVFSQK